MRIVTLASRYGCNQSTIGTIIKNKEAIKSRKSSKGLTHLSGGRTSINDEMERLLLWIKEKEITDDTLTQSVFSHKASAIFANLVEVQRDGGGEVTTQQASQEFKASHGWFDRYRKRTGIRSVVRHGEAASFDKKAAEEFLKKAKNITKKRLSVFWTSNAKTWVTRTIFIEWINVCFGPAVKNYLEESDLPLKCLLVLDNAPAHPPGLEDIIHPHFSLIKVLYLPPNTTPLLQPMDQQVIANFKELYTKHLFKRCLELIESTQLTLREFWKWLLDITQCLKIIDATWNEVSRRTLNSSWKKPVTSCCSRTRL
ncbi:tigger transposable element-derived protein 1-like [Palaemon carinicauda]|uniref:tigger transposable element-derived protein 1-like n=1 Tax=Palaemon carinicauda TaxID=392227 RepID=UPI0035B653D6